MRNLAAISLGLIYGFVVAGLAFIIAGGGHGWVSSLISAVALVLLPLAIVAWVRRRRPLAVAVLAFGGAADIALVLATTREGFEYVERIFATIPLLVFAWGTLWFFWQIALMIGLLRGKFSSRSKI
jgi:hypothetical protein